MSKRVVVTGASSGIGREVALLLAERAHHLVLVARRAELLEELAEECRVKGGEVRVACFDVGDFGACEGLGSALSKLGDGEPVLVNNAGMAAFGDYHESSFAEHWHQMTVNTGGAMAATHAVIPAMLEHGSGQIINVLSIAAETVFPGAAVYSASKAALRQFGKAISEEYRKRGVRVTNLLPGAVNTPLWDSQMGSPPKELMLSSRAVAEAIVDLVSLPSDRVVEEIRLTPPHGVL